MNDSGLRVLVVWEPILPTDWERPSTATLARIHHHGVEQFWDHDHRISREISRELGSDPSGPKPRCCTAAGNLWDFVAVYPAGELWQNEPPKPVFANGPVADVQQELSRELTLLGK